MSATPETTKDITMASKKSEQFETLAIHAGQEFDPTTGAIIPPVYFTSTFVQDGIGGFRNGYEYTRGGNPTRTALETQLAALEGAKHGLAFASGLAAEDALLRALLEPGDRIVLGNDVYGGTHRLIERIHGKWGVENVVVEMSDLAAVSKAVAGGRRPPGPHPVQCPAGLRRRQARLGDHASRPPHLPRRSLNRFPHR